MAEGFVLVVFAESQLIVGLLTYFGLPETTAPVVREKKVSWANVSSIFNTCYGLGQVVALVAIDVGGLKEGIEGRISILTS